MKTINDRQPDGRPTGPLTCPGDFSRPENATGGQLYGPGGWQAINGATASSGPSISPTRDETR
jgi:hypothetical protein